MTGCEESDRNSRENVALKQELSRLQSFGATVMPDLVRDRLKGRSVVLVDTDKVDSGLRDNVRKVLEDAGAEVDGQVTFADERLALGGDADRTAMARLLAVDAAPPRPSAASWSSGWPSGWPRPRPCPRTTTSGPPTCSPASRTPTSWPT